MFKEIPAFGKFHHEHERVAGLNFVQKFDHVVVLTFRQNRVFFLDLADNTLVSLNFVFIKEFAGD